MYRLHSFQGAISDAEISASPKLAATGLMMLLVMPAEWCTFDHLTEKAEPAAACKRHIYCFAEDTWRFECPLVAEHNHLAGDPRVDADVHRFRFRAAHQTEPRNKKRDRMDRGVQHLKHCTEEGVGCTARQ